MNDDAELLELLAEGHAALAAPPLARVHEALTVLPKLVDALDRLCEKHHELRAARLELTFAVHQFRQAVWDIQREHKEVTFNAASIQRCLHRVNAAVDRIDATLGYPD